MKREIDDFKPEPEPSSPRDLETSSIDKKVSDEYMVETVVA